ncbi:MAG TPA: phytanoyl-CoA dioxygenase family protein [Candidatus Binataceae bacterium]|nr:phytanoyl-CoA dioxygenase family protein [Candidatus Binataceae bacterium]
MVSIPHLSSTDRPELLVEALLRDGCAVVDGAANEATRAAVSDELKPHLDKADENAATDRKLKYYAESGGFYPGHTKRVTALLAKSKTVCGLALNPLALAACDVILKPNCSSYQLHASSALVIGPGATEQMLHREEDAFQFFKVPRPDLILATMWAISEFTAANGATNLVPGSHRWPADRRARPDEVVPAAMRAGSVVLWMGGTLHGAGANCSDQWRFGVFLSYSLGWLRQEENQYLDMPWSLARSLPKELRDLLGYKMHRGLGFAEIPDGGIV